MHVCLCVCLLVRSACSSPAARHWAVRRGAALGVQVQQAPHLLAQVTASSHLLLALHSVLEERPDLAAAGAAALRVVATAGMHQQRQRLLQLLVALLAFLLSQPGAHLIPLSKVGGGLAVRQQQGSHSTSSREAAKTSTSSTPHHTALGALAQPCQAGIPVHCGMRSYGNIYSKPVECPEDAPYQHTAAPRSPADHPGKILLLSHLPLHLLLC